MSHHLNPIFKAIEVYRKEPCARTWLEDLELHLIYGYVVSTPDYFIMGRPVKSGAPDAEIVNPSFMWPDSECDAWHIYLAAGNMRKFWDLCPRELAGFKIVTIERKNVLRRYPMGRIQKLICGC